MNRFFIARHWGRFPELVLGRYHSNTSHDAVDFLMERESSMALRRLWIRRKTHPRSGNRRTRV